MIGRAVSHGIYQAKVYAWLLRRYSNKWLPILLFESQNPNLQFSLKEKALPLADCFPLVCHIQRKVHPLNSCHLPIHSWCIVPYNAFLSYDEPKTLDKTFPPQIVGMGIFLQFLFFSKMPFLPNVPNGTHLLRHKTIFCYCILWYRIVYLQ